MKWISIGICVLFVSTAFSGGTIKNVVNRNVSSALSEWQTEVVDGMGNVGLYSSLVVDENGWQYCSYYDKANGDLKYAVWNGVSWDIEVVDSIGDVGMYTSLALDSNGNPHISYYDDTNHDLKYAWWNEDAIEPSWVIETVASVGDVGWGTSLVLISNSEPFISYYDFTNNKLKCATIWLGYWWTDVVDNGGLYNSIDVASDSTIRVAYSGVDGGLRYARYLGDFGAWECIAVDDDATGWDISLSVDNMNRAHISYYDGGYLKYALIGDEMEVDLIETVDYVAYGGWRSSIATYENIPSVSYYDYANKDLKYAEKPNGEWVTETVDSNGDVGWHSSLAMKNGYAHITYYDVTNGNLKKAMEEITEDTEPPEVTIEYPTNGSIFTEPNITVTGYMTDNVGIVSIGSYHQWEDGEEWTSGTIEPTTYYRFEWDFTLHPGENIITISGSDAARNEGEDTIFVHSGVLFPFVDLTIYDGLENAGAEGKGGGGNKVSDDKEEERGAFTVVNMNDGDGDGIPDYADNEVIESGKGRNEVDLMRLNLTIKNPSGGKATLKKTGGNKDVVTLWENPTKIKMVEAIDPPANDTWKFDVGRGISWTKEVWVEIGKINAEELKFHGVQFELEYQGQRDKVSATGIWAKVTSVCHDAEGWTKSGENDLIPAGWEDINDGDHNFVWGSIKAHNGYGVLEDVVIDGVTWIRNLIVIQFKIYPEYKKLSKYGIEFDITRQATWDDVYIRLESEPKKSDPPVRMQWPKIAELPNDDPTREEVNGEVINYEDPDESLKPSYNTGYMYVVDAPGFQKDQSNENQPNPKFILSSSNFREFMRVRLDNIRPCNNTIDGSRCSDYFDWHSCMDLKAENFKNPSVMERFWPTLPNKKEIHPIQCIGRGHVKALLAFHKLKYGYDLPPG